MRRAIVGESNKVAVNKFNLSKKGVRSSDAVGIKVMDKGVLRRRAAACR